MAAVACALAWGLKAVAIGAAGGLDRSPLESPLFVLGLVAIGVAFAALGVSAAGGRSRAVVVAAGLLGVLVGVGLSALASIAAATLIPESAGWVQEEAGLWFSALLALGLTIAWHSSRRTVRGGQ